MKITNTFCSDSSNNNIFSHNLIWQSSSNRVLFLFIFHLSVKLSWTIYRMEKVDALKKVYLSHKVHYKSRKICCLEVKRKKRVKWKTRPHLRYLIIHAMLGMIFHVIYFHIYQVTTNAIIVFRHDGRKNCTSDHLFLWGQVENVQIFVDKSTILWISLKKCPGNWNSFLWDERNIPILTLKKILLGVVHYLYIFFSTNAIGKHVSNRQ